MQTLLLHLQDFICCVNGLQQAETGTPTNVCAETHVEAMSMGFFEVEQTAAEEQV